MLPAPPVKPPPWIHTITGSRLTSAALGVYTFRYRQSSAVLVAGTPVEILPVCAHTLVGLVASLTPRQRAAGRGGRHLSAPVGGAAYGMPMNSRASAVSMPRTAPVSVRTTNGDCRVPDASAVVAPPAARLRSAATRAKGRASQRRGELLADCPLRIAGPLPAALSTTQ